MSAKAITLEQAERFHRAMTGFPQCFNDCCLCNATNKVSQLESSLAEAREEIEGRMLYGAGMAQERNDLLKVVEGLRESVHEKSKDATTSLEWGNKWHDKYFKAWKKTERLTETLDTVATRCLDETETRASLLVYINQHSPMATK